MHIQFRLFHLFVFTTGCGVILAIAQLSAWLALIASVAIFGPTAAHATCPTAVSIVTGLLSAIFWTVLAISVAAPIYANFAYTPPGTSIPTWLVVVPIASSMFGGYIGGTIAID